MRRYFLWWWVGRGNHKQKTKEDYKTRTRLLVVLADVGLVVEDAGRPQVLRGADRALSCLLQGMNVYVKGAGGQSMWAEAGGKRPKCRPLPFFCEYGARAT